MRCRIGSNADNDNVGFHDAFKLYGRPEKYIWDIKDPKSLFFAYPQGQDRFVCFFEKKRSDYMFDYANRKRRIYSWISRKPSMAISASPRSLAFGPSLFRSFIESSTRTKNGPKTRILISFRAKMRIKDSNGKTATLDYRLYRSMKRLRIQTCPGPLHL